MIPIGGCLITAIGPIMFGSAYQCPYTPVSVYRLNMSGCISSTWVTFPESLSIYSDNRSNTGRFSANSAALSLLLQP
jgi:hypothetical protein